jgi:hypothetical protein
MESVYGHIKNSTTNIILQLKSSHYFQLISNEFRKQRPPFRKSHPPSCFYELLGKLKFLWLAIFVAQNLQLSSSPNSQFHPNSLVVPSREQDQFLVRLFSRIKLKQQLVTKKRAELLRRGRKCITVSNSKIC